jgi:integrase
MGVYRRNGKWEIRLQLGGKKYYRQVPEAQNSAQAKLAEATLRREIYEGRYGKAQGEMDFVRYCRDVYLPHLKGHAKTFKNLSYAVETLCRYFKGKRLRDITHIAIEGYKRQRLSGDSQLGRPRKPVTVKAEINTLSAILNLAIDNDLLGTNPCRKVRWPKGSLQSRRERVLTPDEEGRLLAELDGRGEVRAAVVIALHTGLRRHEILRRRVADYDPRAGTLSLTRKGGKRQVIPLNSVARAEVEGLCASAGPDGFLFRSRTGNALTSKGGLFKNALKDAGVNDFTFHDLRHTFLTRLRLLADPFTARDLMGHATLQMTGVYATASMEEMRAAVERLAQGGNVVEFPAGRRQA